MYLDYLKRLQGEEAAHISAPKIAAALGLNEVQVRKDIAAVSSCAGKPKTGFETARLIRDIEAFLGYDSVNEAVLVGAGKLGRALLGYEGFAQFGIRLVAAFDRNADAAAMYGEDAPMILPMEKLADLCRRMGIHIGIITIPATGHTSGDWVTTTKPTCTDVGEQTRTCSTCGAMETREVSATGSHIPGEWVTTKEPTRTEEGERTQSCTVCGEVLATEPIPMLTGLLGDVNEDGKVDAVDARWVLQAAAGMRTDARWVLQAAAGMRTLENATAADVNADGKIDAVDARWILQAAAGMRTL